MSTKKEYLCQLRAAAQERLECLEREKSRPQMLTESSKVEDLWLSNRFIEHTIEQLRLILDGRPVDYAALADSITLEMIACSKEWNTLRYYARRLGWMQEEEQGG